MPVPSATEIPVTRLSWERYYRLINSAYPPIDLFEDIADPEDWNLLGHAESKSNPRLAESVGNLDLVPPSRRVGGNGASYVMAPFTHCSPDKPGRFHDGSTGAFYAGISFETALFETAHHLARFYAATRQEPGWLADMRELVGSVEAQMVDIRGEQTAFDDLLNPDDYRASQAFANQCRAIGREGIVYPSVRLPGGECFVAFYPDVMTVPHQARHFAYHWDGERIDKIRDKADGQMFALEP
ncbi:RES family NAD+ phosphorylase [Oceanibaculum nanhaiense]|uniref:RES family NAD+ phosphorylase n=1 Tax=Oceanibaculum nanhaiense TaxID=1909734 RepID=UPI003D2DB612